MATVLSASPRLAMDTVATEAGICRKCGCSDRTASLSALGLSHPDRESADPTKCGDRSEIARRAHKKGIIWQLVYQYQTHPAPNTHTTVNVTTDVRSGHTSDNTHIQCIVCDTVRLAARLACISTSHRHPTAADRSYTYHLLAYGCMSCPSAARQAATAPSCTAAMAAAVLLAVLRALFGVQELRFDVVARHAAYERQEA